MQLLSLEINGQSILDEVGDIDWGFVKNAPTVNLDDSNYDYTNRYYTKSEIDSRIALLKASVDTLEKKINNLFNN